MKVKHINPVIQGIKEILLNWINEESIQIDKPKIKKSPQVMHDILITIGITGDIKGQVIFGFQNNTFLDIASKMMMNKDIKINEMSKSAIGELTNMIMGNVCTKYSNIEITTDITTPVIYQGTGNISSGLQFLSLPFTINSNVLEVFLTLEEK